jgi:hypothetical protein
VVTASLLGLVMGVIVPRQFIIWMAIHAILGHRNRDSDRLAECHISLDSSDRPLYWTVLSVVSLSAGVAGAMLPISVGGAEMWHTWIQRHFIWPEIPYLFVQIGVALVATGGQMFFLGLGVMCAHHLACRYGRWDARATAWGILGVAGGCALIPWMERVSLGGRVLLLASALPTLVMCLLGVLFAQHDGSRIVEETPCSDELPVWSDRSPQLLRASIIVMSAVTACSMAIWSCAHREENGLEIPAAATLFGCLGAGSLFGNQAGRRWTSIRGFGTACLAVGCGLAVAALGTGSGVGKGMNRFFELSTQCSCVGAIGFAAALGHRALFARVAHRAVVGRAMLVRQLLCVAVVSWIAAPLLTSWLEPPGIIQLTALVSAFQGVVLIGHDWMPLRRLIPFARAGALPASFR